MAEDIVEALARSRHLLRAGVAGMGETVGETRPAPDEWCIKEILGHIIDVDYFYLGEALAAMDGNHRFSYFDDDTWKTTHPQIRRMRMDYLRAALDASHAAVLQQVKWATEEQLTRSCVHPRGIPYTVRDIFLRIAAHDHDHLAQIQSLLPRLPWRRVSDELSMLFQAPPSREEKLP